MAMTTASFGGSYNEATDSAQKASHETPPAVHPLTGTNLPQTTGAGKGTVRKGIVRGGK